jgi:hypothetical protein
VLRDHHAESGGGRPTEGWSIFAMVDFRRYTALRALTEVQPLPSNGPAVTIRVLKRPGASIVLIVAVAALLATVAGCGGGSSEPEVADLPAQAETDASATGTAPSGARDPQDILVDFTRCLREQGVDVPDPDFNASPEEARKRLEEAGIDLDDPRVQKAFQTCQPLLLGILQSLTPEQVQAFRDAIVDYARCMREHGVDLPDPDFSGGLNIFGDAVDPTDPAFQAANEECSKIFRDIPNPFAEQ